MATDYNEVSENPRINFRPIFTLYSDKTHFVYELIQNADDNKSQCIELQLYENGLLVWNDGIQFSEKDVRSICSIGFSNKDLTQIGSFGMGFKAVYTYTDIPEVYSGDERFRLPIKNPMSPEGIDIGEINAGVVELLEKGSTVFWLPFREKMRQESEIKHLRDRLYDLEKRSLLFLRHLKTVRWYDESNGQKGIYSCQRSPYKKIQNASKVELKASVNGNEQPSEIFLVFRKEVRPPKDVINQLVQQEEYDEDKERIKRSAEKLQHVEVAFKLQDERIVEMDSCVLFAYLPTKMKTNLRFLIQARYQTTPARDNISMNSPWNEWLMKETAEFLPDVLEELKIGDLLTPTFYNVIPLQDDKVPIEYETISKSLQKAMKNRPFVPIHNGGYAKAECVRYSRAKSLYQLIESDWIKSIEWLHPEIPAKESSRCFRVMREAGVKEALFDTFLTWLKKQHKDWFEARDKDWLHSLYLYLDKQKSKMERITELPLVRLEDGSHICAIKDPAFFPPNTSEERAGIALFINELPIVQRTLLGGNVGDDIKSFLKSIGVKTMHPVHLIERYILPKYLESDKEPTEELNRVHLHYLHTVWSKKPPELSKLKAKISDTPILLAYREGERKSLCLKKPCQVYLPETYTGNADLEIYFSGSDNVWYVDDGYLDDNSDPKIWLQFLKWIGAMDTPQVIRNRKDSYLDGLQEVLARIYNEKNTVLSQTLWNLLINPPKSFDVSSCRYLKETAWVPDEQDDLYRPSECFLPTDENLNILRDSVAYLHPDLDIGEDNKDARLLAEKLGIHLNANTESVMNYLQTLSGSKADIEDIEPLYFFLSQRNVSFPDIFKEECLIYAPNPEKCWWRSNEVFWEEESVVFGQDCGYLKTYYSEQLKPFFVALGVNERAAPLDCVRGIQEIASVEEIDDPETRERCNNLYHRLWRSLQEGGNWQSSEEWNQTRESKCWLGKIGNKWDFFSRHELVWNDHHDYIAEIFEGEIPFWGFDDLLELARNLEIEGCSQAKSECFPSGEQEENGVWSDKVRKLQPYIHDFLNSPRLCETQEKSKSHHVLDLLSVRLVEKLETMYTLKRNSLTHPYPRQSFLDVTNQRATLWIALEAEECQYTWLIGDALQDYFGDIKELSGFVEDLLTKDKDSVLTRWKQKGLQADIFVPPLVSEIDISDVENPVDGKDNDAVTDEVDKPDTLLSIGDSENDIPMVTEKHDVQIEDDNIDDNIRIEKHRTPTYTQHISHINQSSDSSKSTSSIGCVVDSHDSSGDMNSKVQYEETEVSLQAKKEIEHIGMEHARRYEESRDCVVEDVSADNLGFDLRSTSLENITRCIEVKARADYDYILLTQNEWSKANELKDDYFLYVVLNAATQPTLYIIQNPADAISIVKQVDVRYQVPLSEITDHGKLV